MRTVAMVAARFGTAGHDVLIGTDTADQMYGHAGDDINSGLGGNDLMYGGWGEDALWDSYGDDNLYGRSGADDLHGVEGADYLSAKDGKRDFVDCGSGRDWYNTDFFDVVRNLVNRNGLHCGPTRDGKTGREALLSPLCASKNTPSRPFQLFFR